MMRAALLITAKDLRARLRDRSAYIVGLVAPLALALIFTFVFGGLGADDVTFSFGLVDLDGGPLASAFHRDVLSSLADEGIATITVIDDEAAARRVVSDGDIDAAFVIPEGFSAAVDQSRPVTIHVLGNADAQVATQAATSIANAYGASIERVEAAVAAATAGGHPPPAEIAALVQRVARSDPPVAVDTSGVADKELDPETQNSAAMAIMFLFFTVQFGVVGYLEERREGTMARLLVAVPHSSILAGKALTSIVMGAISMTVLLVAATVLMGAHFGDPAGVAVLVAAGIVAAVALVVTVTAFSHNAEQAGNLQSMIGVLLAMFGGAFFSLSQAPQWMVAVSRITPHAWFLAGLGDLSAGGSVGDILPAAGAMLLFAAVVLLIGIVPLRRTVSR